MMKDDCNVKISILGVYEDYVKLNFYSEKPIDISVTQIRIKYDDGSFKDVNCCSIPLKLYKEPDKSLERVEKNFEFNNEGKKCIVIDLMIKENHQVYHQYRVNLISREIIVIK